jgi:hypothetical protein
MNPAPLAEGPVLRDIHLPPAPGWWPPAPGWWLLAVLILVVVAIIAFRVLRIMRARRWRWRIRAEVERIAARHAAQPDAARLAAELSGVMRRASLLLDPCAAALRGEEWLSFLDARAGGDTFRAGPGRALLDAPYRRVAEFDTGALVRAVRDWLARVLADHAPRPRARRGRLRFARTGESDV